jgi:hypothetical protein
MLILYALTKHGVLRVRVPADMSACASIVKTTLKPEHDGA